MYFIVQATIEVHEWKNISRVVLGLQLIFCMPVEDILPIKPLVKLQSVLILVRHSVCLCILVMRKKTRYYGSGTDFTDKEINRWTPQDLTHVKYMVQLFKRRLLCAELFMMAANQVILQLVSPSMQYWPKSFNGTS